MVLGLGVLGFLEFRGLGFRGLGSGFRAYSFTDRGT